MTIKYIDHSLINSEKDYWEAENDLQKKMLDLMIQCVDKETEIEFIKDCSDRLEKHKTTYQISHLVNEEISQLQHEVYLIKDKLIDLEEIYIHRFDFGFLQSHAMKKHREKRISDNINKVEYLRGVNNEDCNHIYRQLKKFESNIY